MVLDILGTLALTLIYEIGKVGIFTLTTLKTLVNKRPRLGHIIQQINYIGVSSSSVVSLTGACIGAVLAVHAYNGLNKFGTADQFLGPLVYLSMCNEFGSVISSIMVIARAGSAMTAEIGSIKISEQIDALTTLSIDPFSYIVVPRVVATTIILPLLSLICIIFGVGAGYVIAVYSLGVNAETYVDSIRSNVILTDITYGLIKAACFGFLASIICTYKGMITSGGARGVGQSTTQSVVLSCVAVFISNYILTSILFPPK